MNTIKSGVKTSEFWLSAAALVVGFLLAAGLFGDTSIWAKLLGVAAQVLTALGYTVVRSSLKKAAITPSAVLITKPPTPTQ